MTWTLVSLVSLVAALLPATAPLGAAPTWHDTTLRRDRGQLFLRLATAFYAQTAGEQNKRAGEACNWSWAMETPSEESYSLGFSWNGGPRCYDVARGTAIRGYVEFRGRQDFRLHIFVRAEDVDVFPRWRQYEKDAELIAETPEEWEKLTTRDFRKRWPDLTYPPSDESSARSRFEALRPTLELAVGNPLRLTSVIEGASMSDRTSPTTFGWGARFDRADAKDGSAIGCTVHIDPIRGEVVRIFADMPPRSTR